MNYYKEV